MLREAEITKGGIRGEIGGGCIRYFPEYKFSFTHVMNAQHTVMPSEGRAVASLCTVFKEHLKVFNKE
ncbi:hypothetical protein K502DRAFT_351562 [Neoconidiobolus thromboides FSU 785]|nr:hypothetical protein K502DRAFT_351562 [Neoconidiobolus thromboides FSU 785]